MSKYFSPEEFKRCNPPCDINQMDAVFLSLLDKVREEAGIPLVLNCAYRSREHDLSKGRTGNSSHTKGKAVDIRCNQGSTCFRIVNAALKCGITRVGIGNGFVHLDNDESLPQEVIFNYY